MNTEELLKWLLGIGATGIVAICSGLVGAAWYLGNKMGALDSRIGSLEASVDSRIVSLESNMDSRIRSLESTLSTKIDHIGNRITPIEDKVEYLREAHWRASGPR